MPGKIGRSFYWWLAAAALITAILIFCAYRPGG
jgi:uncharacterized membrane protein YhaH (DUF805 family)